MDTQALFDRLQRDSDLLIDQLRAIDNRRLIKGPLARLEESLMATAGAAIMEVLDLVDVAGSRG